MKKGHDLTLDLLRKYNLILLICRYIAIIFTVEKKIVLFWIYNFKPFLFIQNQRYVEI